METFNELYNRLVKASFNNRLNEEISQIKAGGGYNNYTEEHLNYIMHPEKQPAVINTGQCDGCGDGQNKSECEVACLFSAIKRDKNNRVIIEDVNCVGCGRCLEACKKGNLVDRKDLIPVLELLNERKRPVYAMIAPAFNGQFSTDVTAGKLRTAFKMLGFYGMLEVALFADILTLKEALEFDKSIKDDKDFILTSCCCPIWVAMIKKIYNELIPHMPPSVSPMVACGRAIKKIQPDAVTVFIGPCIAKKAEAKEPDIRDAVDYVLTFKETNDLFELAGFDLAGLEEDQRDHSSKAGRIYARTGGVSKAVQLTLDRLSPGRKIRIKATQAEGVAECKELLREITRGDIRANFIEGMGCVGGCVGGPRVLIPHEKGTEFVNNYGNQATYRTPIDNEYVIRLLESLGFKKISDLLQRDNMFTREFHR